MIQKIRNTLQEQMLEYMFWKRQNGSDFLIQVSKLAPCSTSDKYSVLLVANMWGAFLMQGQQGSGEW